MEQAAALDSSVLVLNRFFMAVQVVSARKAFALLCKEIAEVVYVNDDKYDFYDLEPWKDVSRYRELFPDHDNDWVRTVSFEVKVPRVIRLLVYDRLPQRAVRLNRRNIFARDENCCQYCGRHFPASELSIDHVVPRSQGGRAQWRNMVCACTSCNKRKGGRTPGGAGMRLIRKPVAPRRSPIIRLKLRLRKYESWKNFLDSAYWSVPLT